MSSIKVEVTIMSSTPPAPQPGSDWTQLAVPAGVLAGTGTSAALIALLRGDIAALPAGLSYEEVNPLPNALPEKLNSTLEQAVGVDQTNTTVIVAERIAVKWFRTASTLRSPKILTKLAQAHYRCIPQHFGTLSRAADASVIAMIDQFLPGTSDGWEWCIEDLKTLLSAEDLPTAELIAAGDRLGQQLGALTGELHVALAAPAPGKLEDALPQLQVATCENWFAQAADLMKQVQLDSAIAPTQILDEATGELLGPEFAGPDIVAELAQLATNLTAEYTSILAQLHRGDLQVPLIPIHGDLHIGQLLRGTDPEQLWVIDFDGNPTVPDEDVNTQPAARDVAQLMCSLLNAGQVALRQMGLTQNHAAQERINHWHRAALFSLQQQYVQTVSAAGLTHLHSPTLVDIFLQEQFVRELRYATHFLPRWRYAPAGALVSWLSQSN